MSKYSEIVSEERKLKKRLEELETSKTKLENDVLVTFGKGYMDRRELKITDFIEMDKEKLEQKVADILNEDSNFDNMRINYNHNNEK